MDQEIKKLPDSELEVMQVVWSLKAPAGRADIEVEMQKRHSIAQTTLLTLLSRLASKGFLEVHKNGRSSEYTPKVPEADYLAVQSRNFFERVCGGKVSAFASALSNSGLSKEDLEELRVLLEKGEL